MSEQGLEQEWRSIQKIINDKSFLVYPSTIGDDESVVVWGGEQGVDSFLDLAHKLGVRMIYANAAYFGEEDISEIEGRLIPDEETAASPEVRVLLSNCRTFTGRIAVISLDWVYSDIWHRYIKLADWYVKLEERISQVEEIFQERNREIREGNRESELKERRNKAEQLAKERDFQLARGGMVGRRRVVAKMFPDLSETEIMRLDSEAWVFYQSEILPKQERQQANQIRLMLAKDGATKNKVAIELGMRPEKLAKLLLNYPE